MQRSSLSVLRITAKRRHPVWIDRAGEAAAGSDIDLLVLLAAPFDYFAELRQIVDLIYPIQLESEELISAKPALASDYEMGSISLYRNARREGVAV
jgi:hypothetical protein